MSSEPQTDILLNCWVLGDDTSSIFPISIPLAGTVGTLKKLIKEDKKPQFDVIPADRINLWQVSLAMPPMGY
jgi:hypothetical protein